MKRIFTHVFIISIFFLSNCTGVVTFEPKRLDLNGSWSVYHQWFSNFIVDTTYLEILHEDSEVWFIEDSLILSHGTISNDTIRCEDIYHVGISRIYIINSDSLISEKPSVEEYEALIFLRTNE